MRTYRQCCGQDGTGLRKKVETSRVGKAQSVMHTLGIVAGGIGCYFRLVDLLA